MEKKIDTRKTKLIFKKDGISPCQDKDRHIFFFPLHYKRNLARKLSKQGETK